MDDGEDWNSSTTNNAEDLFRFLSSSTDGATPIKAESRFNLTSSFGFVFPHDSQQTGNGMGLFPQTPSSLLFLNQSQPGLSLQNSHSHLVQPAPYVPSNAHAQLAQSTLSLPPHPTPQPPQAQQTAQQILGTIYQLLMEQDEKLKKLHQEQLQFLQQPIPDHFNALAASQRTLREQMETEMRALVQLTQQVIMDPPDLARMMVLQQELRIQMKQLELYQAELQQLVQPQAPAQPIAALVLRKQPFPVVISKGKQLGEEQLSVQLLTGAFNSPAPVSPVKATLLCDTHNPPAKGAPSSPLEGDTQQMAPSRIAHFPLRFVAGTRKSAVHIKLGVPVRMGAATATIESEMSNPFVVITNECQWEGSAGTLLKKDAFGGQLEIPWPQFVNTLQRHFLIATKQDMVRPKRALSLYDFHYINSQFFGNRTIIQQKDFDHFWNWFGKSMQTLRYQRHISTLWQNGIIYGFMNRDDVNAALVNQESGTFIIRFSERNPGQFGIAYCSVEHPVRIKHYLVQPNDCFAAKKTFPDFLSECPQFMYLLQLTSDATGRPTFTRLHKDIVLEPYAAKKHHPSPLGGYEPLSS